LYHKVRRGQLSHDSGWNKPNKEGEDQNPLQEQCVKKKMYSEQHVFFWGLKIAK
jgi:hypothetical protein